MTGGLTGRLQLGLSYAFLITLLLLVLFPFYWMLVTSFKTEDQMRSLVSMFWPSPFALENYGQLLRKTEFVSWYGNSVIVAVSSTLRGHRHRHHRRLRAGPPALPRAAGSWPAPR